MENTNINPESLGEPKTGMDIPVSPEMPKMVGDLSTAPIQGGTSAPKMNEPMPFHNGTNAEPAKTSPNAEIQKAFKKEKAAMASLTKKGNPKIKKIITIVAASVIGLAIIIGAVYYFISVSRKIPVTITVNQQGFNLVIDSKEYDGINSPYTVSLVKGTHTVIVKKQDFADLTKTLDVSLLKSSYALSFELSQYQAIEKIIEKEIFFAAYNKDLDSLSYFDKTDTGYGLKEFSLSTQQESSILENIKQIDKIAWSPTFQQLNIKITNSAADSGGQIPFLDKYPEGTQINWVVNLDRKDLVNITLKDLYPAIKNVSFSPQGDKIVYYFQNDSAKQIATANTDGSGYETIIPAIKTVTFEPDVVWSPDGKRVAIFANTSGDASSNATQVDVYSYSFETRAIAKLSADGTSVGALFSPDGSKLLYQSGNGIWLYDFNAQNGTGLALDLKLQANLANCAWVDAQSFVALSSSDNILYNIRTSGIKDSVNYQVGTLPANIKSILFGNGKIYLLNSDGVYQLALQKNI